MRSPDLLTIERDQRRANELGADSIRCRNSTTTADAVCVCTCSRNRCTMSELVAEHERSSPNRTTP